MKRLLLFFAVAMFSFGAYAQVKPQPTTLPVNVGVEVSDNVNVTKISDVYFGGVYTPTDNIDVALTMDHTGLVKVTAGTTTLYNQVAQRLGQIRIVASSEADFNITAPEIVKLKNQGGNDEGEPIPDLIYTPKFFDMKGNTIDMSLTSYDFDSEQYGTISIGGKLDVPADSFRGRYSGVMNVNISWL